MNLRQRLRKGWFALLTYTVNPLTSRLARSSVGPFSLVRHRGRRSGTVYETPVIVSRVTDGFVIELTYGPQVDWYKNVVAAGGCTVIWHGEAYVIKGVEPIPTPIGMAAFPRSQQLILRLLRRTHFRKLLVQHAASTVTRTS